MSFAYRREAVASDLVGFDGVAWGFGVLVNTHWFAEKVEGFINGLTQRRPGETKRQGFHRAGKGAKDFGKVERGKRKEELGIRREEIGVAWPKVRVFYEEVLLGSAGTLWANKDWVGGGEAFFILYGDNLTNVDLGKMWDFHQGHGLPFTLGVFKAENPKACGIAEVDGDGVVTGFVEKPDEPKSDLAAAGVYVADSRILIFFHVMPGK